MKTEKQLRTELRQKGLRKRTSRRLAADASSARAHGRPVPQRTTILIDDLERVLQEVKRTNNDRVKDAAPKKRPASKTTGNRRRQTSR